MTALVVRANAGRLPLSDASVDLVVTSPPYFALRSYTDGGEHYAGQIGSEPTPAEFLDALWGCTREWMRVLKPSGSIWVNLGDKYGRGSRMTSTDQSNVRTGSVPAGIPATGFDKSLMGLPWRYAIGCIDQLGLILRANVIWSKPNGLPESVTDRVRRSHEDWFHFTKQPRYFSAVDEIREQYADDKDHGATKSYGQGVGPRHGTNNSTLRLAGANLLGKLPGSVWEIPSEPLTVPDHLGVDHFAAFPTEFPRRIIQGWSQAGICCECGDGRRPVGDREPSEWEARKLAGEPMRHGLTGAAGAAAGNFKPLQTTITGYACACLTPDAPTRPAVVLDPFGGTGTTALCASVLGRVGISVDLSHDYSRLAQWRTQDPASRAKAMRVDKPPVQLDGQAELFGGAA